jgi:hypothetical protein
VYFGARRDDRRSSGDDHPCGCRQLDELVVADLSSLVSPSRASQIIWRADCFRLDRLPKVDHLEELIHTRDRWLWVFRARAPRGTGLRLVYRSTCTGRPVCRSMRAPGLGVADVQRLARTRRPPGLATSQRKDSTPLTARPWLAIAGPPNFVSGRELQNGLRSSGDASDVSSGCASSQRRSQRRR